MAKITAQQAGGTNTVAFLDMLAWSEGTDNGKQATKDDGYDVIVGGQLFKSYDDHPRVLVDLPKLKIQSTAAGRYQLLRRYYDAYKKTLGLKDFSPLSQDLIALQQIRERRALPTPNAPRSGAARARIWRTQRSWAISPIPRTATASMAWPLARSSTSGAGWWIAAATSGRGIRPVQAWWASRAPTWPSTTRISPASSTRARWGRSCCRRSRASAASSR
uniref:glycoside hydrolase family 24 protein n=1 Tax=Stenotrophomonas maltophilia TaxID=40324 RepID=UPI003EB80DA0